MKNNTILILAISIIAVLGTISCLAQRPQPDEVLMEQARREYLTGKFDNAVQDFRELTNHDPSNITAQLYLGHSLFREAKYAEAVSPYEKVHQLETSHPLSLEQHRILIDQLTMSYGISGDLKKAHDLLETAIQQDPKYPLNYYNLACVFAEREIKTRCSPTSLLHLSEKIIFLEENGCLILARIPLSSSTFKIKIFSSS